MTAPWRPLFIILAIVLFLVGLILTLSNGEAKTIQIMLFGGLASFAAGHLP